MPTLLPFHFCVSRKSPKLVREVLLGVRITLRDCSRACYFQPWVDQGPGCMLVERSPCLAVMRDKMKECLEDSRSLDHMSQKP
ncbi:hypothetical protein AOLI_G00099360 [Acnodon oligacanthus]